MADHKLVDCDVLIVGGGPAGSACGWKLRQAGVDVTIMDRESFPRDKVCAGWITPQVVKELAIDLDDYRREHVLQPIHGFRTGVMGGPLLQTRYEETVSHAIRRCEFDNYLLKRSGAMTLQGVPFRSAERTDNGWKINDNIRSRMLIGAGGHFCPVSRMINPQANPSRDLIAAQEAEYVLSNSEAAACAVEPDVPELYFYPDFQGYAWCVRKGPFINIGLGRDHEQNLTHYRDRFLEYLLKTERIGSLPEQKFHGHAYRVYRRPQRRVVDDRLLLIGDAAGLAYPQSGEGIRTAIESGLLAAEVVMEANPLFTPVALAVYERRLAEHFGRCGNPYVSPDRWRSRSRAATARLLLRSQWFTRHVLLDRWFLHRHESSLSEL